VPNPCSGSLILHPYRPVSYLRGQRNLPGKVHLPLPGGYPFPPKLLYQKPHPLDESVSPFGIGQSLHEQIFSPRHPFAPRPLSPCPNTQTVILAYLFFTSVFPQLDPELSFFSKLPHLVTPPRGSPVPNSGDPPGKTPSHHCTRQLIELPGQWAPLWRCFRALFSFRAQVFP